MVIIEIIAAYLFFVFILLRLIVPHMGFGESRLPEEIPAELSAKITELNSEAKTGSEFLISTYNYVVQKYSGSRIKTITEFWRAFGDVYKKKPGFLPCTGQNFLLRIMLVKSGRFDEGDIKIKTVPLNFFIHQYLIVKVDGVWIDVDPWSHFLGKRLGQKLSYFG